MDSLDMLGDDVPASTPNSNSGQQNPPPKRRRLNFACNYCRARKTRCDEQKPSCHACIVAGVACVTTDRRRPGVTVERRGAGAGAGGAAAAAAGNRPPPPAFSTSSAPAAVRRDSSSLSRPDLDRDSTNWPNPLTPNSAGEGDGLGPASGSGSGPIPVLHDSVRSPELAAMHRQADGSTDVRFAGTLPLVPRIAGTNTLEMLTGWLDLAFYRLGVKLNFTTMFDLYPDHHAADGLSTSITSSSLIMPQLPSSEEGQRLITFYFSQLNSIFPVLEPRPIVETFREARCSIPPVTSSVDTSNLRAMLILYLVLALACLESDTHLDLAEQYVHFCQFMLGHVIGWRSFEAVQIVFLLALALRWQDRIAGSWSVMSLCVSMAQMLGIERRRPLWGRHEARPATAGHTAASETDDPRRRLWWSIYAFEKLSAFEFGRPSTIRDAECDQLEPGDGQPAALDPDKPNFFRILVSLAKVLSEINGRSIHNRSQEERSNAQTLERAVYGKVQTTGEMVVLLMKWGNTLPDGLRPRIDMIPGTVTQPQAAFISTQFHNALMILLRNSFLINEEAIHEATNKYAVGQSWSYVIRNGQSITTNAARATIRSLVERAEQNVRPVCSLVLGPLHALYILSIHLITHPTSRLAHSDLDLMYHAAEFAQMHASKCSPENKLHDIISKLLDYVGAVVDQAAATAVPSPASSFRQRMRRNTMESATTASPGSLSTTSTALSADVGDQAVFEALIRPSAVRRLPGQVDNNVPSASPALMETMGLGPGPPTEVLDLGDMEWFPALPDEIGWDWGDFGELLRDGMPATQ